MSEERDFDRQGAAVLRMLIYPVQFESEPVYGIDRVVAQVFAEHWRISRLAVIVAIDAGMASDAKCLTKPNRPVNHPPSLRVPNPQPHWSCQQNPSIVIHCENSTDALQ
ncbi:hypothetical protein SBA5_380029 [Candidatus Sulfotelmatomonas gaucii]|uniref:Uncharacterized protein n=1 Tax=Candidatus Sulfuritelmatomonas gaucii TaxID=2043161 RepID=A0A2N9LIZ6_9BACT|nr:hypothetical protein SBA5_380029 [Candidatus Sulfotelmatomonas gaucii]